jgi:hypothetical protein
MNQEHEAHLQRILAAVTHDIDRKYRAGQLEHGGELWKKPRMLENAIDEVLDLAVYLYTLKEQRDGAMTLLKPELCGVNASSAGVSGT